MIGSHLEWCEPINRFTAMHTETDITQPQRLIPHIMKEMSFLAFIPLGIMAEIDVAGNSGLITSVIAAIVGLFSSGHYIAQIRKNNAERKLIELELAEKQGKRRRKPKSDHEDKDH